MLIRHAEPKDLDRILQIYAIARQTMKKTGNPSQWSDYFPPTELIHQDIACQRNYVVEHEGRVQGVFALIEGLEPNYQEIQDGTWLNEDPYVTIHRVASGGEVRGVMHTIMTWCKHNYPNIRIDTHHDNKIMRHLIETHGFTRCGIIHVEDGSARIAYQFVQSGKCEDSAQ